MIQCVKEILERLKPELLALSHSIHSHPELGFEEYYAASLQKNILEKYQFNVQMPFCGMATAYKASKICGNGEGATVAFLAEYDGLKNIGHACGHNLIAASSVGAALALTELKGFNGTVVVLGTPAEEGGGGKVYICDRGGLQGIDAALMMHPGTKNLYGRGGIAATNLVIRFLGKASHAVEPQKGINALSSMIALFNGINAYRQVWDKGHVITGIITDGGKAPNVIPDRTEAKFVPRHPSRKGLINMLEDIKRIAHAAADLTGAQVEVDVDPIYAERHPNITMGERFRDHMQQFNEVVYLADASVPLGSSDIGNVSLLVPTIQEYLQIAEETTTSHSDEFREAAISKRGDQVIILAAGGLALTAYDFLTDKVFRSKVQEEFKRETMGYR